ncbi:MAG: purine-binding chemotaxis protein CheW [Leptolyngbyaceae cyanobacterium SM2_5_2]|nr:purine-binding chemotaxis protein CheW [Leptolyngbyaceae cyanobacterium SM2_5_2]
MSDLSLVALGSQSTSTELAPKAFVSLTHSYLNFSLGTQSALLPTRQVQEAITIPAAHITPIPNMPPAILGLINRRSQVLWVADLALMLGLAGIAYPTTQQYNLVLVQIGSVIMGLRVHQVVGILSTPPDQIQPAPAYVPPSLVPFLQGCVLQDKDVLLVLDGEAILQAPALRSPD